MNYYLNQPEFWWRAERSPMGFIARLAGCFNLKTALLALALAFAATGSVPAADSISKNSDAGGMTSAAATNVSAAAFASSVDVLDDKYHLVIGDQLSFRIIEDEGDPVVLAITDSGDLQVPYLGRYPAAGKTCKQLSLALKTELEKKYYYQATVVVAVNAMPRSRGKIYLVGAIRAPGPQEISSDEDLTLSKAILRSGGFTDFANEKKVKVTRNVGPGTADKQTFIVDVSQILEKGQTQSDLPLLPGDLIYVPEKIIRF
jgi:polysaccharide export outer membrane protein